MIQIHSCSDTTRFIYAFIYVLHGIRFAIPDGFSISLPCVSKQIFHQISFNWVRSWVQAVITAICAAMFVYVRFYYYRLLHFTLMLAAYIWQFIHLCLLWDRKCFFVVVVVQFHLHEVARACVCVCEEEEKAFLATYFVFHFLYCLKSDFTQSIFAIVEHAFGKSLFLPAWFLSSLLGALQLNTRDIS